MRATMLARSVTRQDISRHRFMRNLKQGIKRVCPAEVTRLCTGGIHRPLNYLHQPQSGHSPCLLMKELQSTHSGTEGSLSCVPMLTISRVQKSSCSRLFAHCFTVQWILQFFFFSIMLFSFVVVSFSQENTIIMPCTCLFNQSLSKSFHVLDFGEYF